jgi:hypothetical protein
MECVQSAQCVTFESKSGVDLKFRGCVHVLFAPRRTSLVAGPLIYIFADKRTTQYCISCLVLMYLMVSSSSLICYEKYKHRFADPNGAGNDSQSGKSGLRTSRVASMSLRRQNTNNNSMRAGLGGRGPVAVSSPVRCFVTF